MTISKGIYYFPTFEAARDHARSVGAPTDRIIHYGLGWVIQWRVSGPYVGPETPSLFYRGKQTRGSIHD